MTSILKVRFTKEATCEFMDSVQWYESKGKGLGLSFTDEMDSLLERIRLNPDMYPNIAENIRRIQMNKFPYSVFYTIENDFLIILRVFHNKRSPIKWVGK